MDKKDKLKKLLEIEDKRYKLGRLLGHLYTAITFIKYMGGRNK